MITTTKSMNVNDATKTARELLAELSEYYENRCAAISILRGESSILQEQAGETASILSEIKKDGAEAGMPDDIRDVRVHVHQFVPKNTSLPAFAYKFDNIAALLIEVRRAVNPKTNRHHAALDAWIEKTLTTISVLTPR